MKIIIDREFSEYIPPLGNSERRNLEDDLIANGCKDPLKVWRTDDGDILLDGHNRYEICTEHELTFTVEPLHFDSRDAALAWMIKHQLGRRNVNSIQSSYLRGRRYNGEKKAHGAPEGNKNASKQSNQSDTFVFTRQRLAEDYHVGEATIVRDGQLAHAIDWLTKKFGRKFWLSALNPDTGAKKGDIVKAHRFCSKSDMPEEAKVKAKEAVKAIIDGKRPELLRLFEEIRQLIARQAPGPKNSEPPKPKKKPTVELASWREWLNRQDDCDLLLTDPPYMTDVRDIRSFAAEWLPVALAKVKPTGRAYVCIGAYPEEIAAYIDADHGDMELANILVWTYRNTMGPSPKRQYKQNWQAILYFIGPEAGDLNCPELTEQFSVQDINAPDGRIGDRYHAWQKPMELAERFIRHSTKEGDLVLDPFVCTGTFVLAAVELGRVGRGCDISDEHLQIAIRRGCVLQGQKQLAG